MKKFKDKQELFEYILEKYSGADTILIRGSTAKGDIKEFSDIDIEFYQDNASKPEYEIILINEKIVLLTAYPYKSGKKLEDVPENAVDPLKEDER